MLNSIFSLSKNLTNIINIEINDINNYIKIYSNEYFTQNLLYFHYNLYNFRKYFLNDELKILINELQLLFNDTLKIHFKELINENYKLSFQYMNEENNFLNSFGIYRLLSSEFINRYYAYKSSFQEFAFLSSSEELLELIEQFFFQVKNFILEYITNKIKSINEYYFSNEIYKDNFYLVELMNNEIYKIINNINNFFNDEKLNSDIKTKIIEISFNEIQPYNQQKEIELDNLYNYIYNRADYYKIHDSSSDFVNLIIIKKKKWYKKKKYYQIINNYYCPHRDNINKINTNLSKTKEYLTEKINIFNNNYINKYDLYLNNYISLVQSLYNNLYYYYEGKINNHDNIKTILNDYQLIFNDLLMKYSNEKIFKRINKEFNISNTNIYLNKLEKNIINIKESYFNNYYLIDSNDFLEYPEEIIFKIEEISEILKENNEMIKNKINYTYIKKILNIIGSTKLFINNINDFNFQYIMKHININNIIQRYYLYKHNLIKSYFNSFSNKLNEVFDNNIITTGLKEQILNENNYDCYTYKILNNYTKFLSYFEGIIKENFTIKNCSELLINNSIYENFENNYLNINESNITEMNYSNITECSYEKYKSNLNYSRYNFNIIKLRTEISYTKRLIEKFYSLFDDLNYKNIINFNQINQIDQIDQYSNNKNILYIYNETLYKLNEIKKEGLLLIEEPFEELVQFFQKKSTLENEYMPFFYDFEKLLKYENNYYKNNITELNKKILDNIYNLLDKFNKTLYLQTLLKNNYDYYSLNHYYFESIYNYYYSLLKNCFDKYKQKIRQLKNNTSFYNILKENLDNLQLNKRIFLENRINNFSLNYEYESIGFTYNLTKDLISFIKKEYIDYEFSFIYDYYELFEKYSIIYSEKIIEEISLLQNNVEKELESIYEQFLKIYTNDIHYTSNEYINEIKINYTNCINYPIDLNNEITQELNNSNITELEDFINNNCSINRIIDYLLNNTNDSTCLNLSEINSTIYFNEVYNILNCYNNNNYNYSVIIFDNFDDIYKDVLDNIIINITKEIESNYIDEIYLS